MTSFRLSLLGILYGILRCIDWVKALGPPNNYQYRSFIWPFQDRGKAREVHEPAIVLTVDWSTIEDGTRQKETVEMAYRVLKIMDGRNKIQLVSNDVG